MICLTCLFVTVALYLGTVAPLGFLLIAILFAVWCIVPFDTRDWILMNTKRLQKHGFNKSEIENLPSTFQAFIKFTNLNGQGIINDINAYQLTNTQRETYLITLSLGGFHYITVVFIRSFQDWPTTHTRHKIQFDKSPLTQNPIDYSLNDQIMLTCREPERVLPAFKQMSEWFTQNSKEKKPFYNFTGLPLSKSVGHWWLKENWITHSIHGYIHPDDALQLIAYTDLFIVTLENYLPPIHSSSP